MNQFPIDINTKASTATGKINVYVYEIMNGNGIKKSMNCKYNYNIGFEILFCDFINHNKIYYGIKLSNDGEINNINPTTKVDSKEKDDENNNSNDKEKSDVINNNSNNNDKTETNKVTNKENNDNNNEEKEINDDENKDINNNDIKKDNNKNKNNNDNNILEENNNSKNVEKSENKKTNLFNMSKGASIGTSAACFAAASVMAGILIHLARKPSGIFHKSGRKGGGSGGGKNLNLNNGNKNNNNNVNLAPKRTIKTFIFRITTMTCAGILIIIPLLKRVNIEIESESIYGIEDTT